jgi:hypothetical protein
MKKTLVFGTAALALLSALVFSGCPAEESSTPKVQITVIGLTSPPLPADSQFYSISVFEPGSTITSSDKVTKLGGDITYGVGMGSTPSPTSNVSIEISEITSGNYILVLGASPNMNGEGGKMFITATGTGDSAIRKTVDLDFSNGRAEVPFSEFAKTDAGTGWEAGDIISIFGTPTP